MDRKNNPNIALEEILRRLKLVEDWLPPAYAEPAEDKWKFIVALLLQDEEIFSRFNKIANPRSRGRHKVSEVTKKHPPKRLIALANEFDEFYESLRREDGRKGIVRRTQILAIKDFLRKRPAAFDWLPESTRTIERLIIQGRKMRAWPEIIVDDRSQIVHPVQAECIEMINSQFFLSECLRIDAVQQILSMQYDRPGDMQLMQQFKSLFIIRAANLRDSGLPSYMEFAIH